MEEKTRREKLVRMWTSSICTFNWQTKGRKCKKYWKRSQKNKRGKMCGLAIFADNGCPSDMIGNQTKLFRLEEK